jgi:hypothetical protein
MKLALSQVILGVRDLRAAADAVTSLGFTVVDGGAHPGLGTANRIVPLGDAYLELLGVVDHAAASSNWFGQGLLGAIAHGDRLVRWSLRTDDIDAVAGRLGLEAERRSRIRPDGVRLTWRAAGIESSLRRPWLPFFMQWDDPADYPGATPVRHPNGATGVAWLELTPEDPEMLERWIAPVEPPIRVVAGPAGLHRVGIATAAGVVVLAPSRPAESTGR